jgi:hypothetical protein
MILLEVSDADLMAPGHLPRIDSKRLIPSIDETRRISNQGFQKRGFAGAISSDQSDLLSAAHGRCEIVKHAEHAGCSVI